MGSQAPGSVPGGALSPNPMKRSHTIELQVFLLFFFFYLNREPHLALSFATVSEPPSLWRRGKPVGDTEGFILDDLEIAQEAHLLVPTCRPHSSQSGPAARVTWLHHLLPTNGQEGEQASILPHHPHPSCTSTSIVSQCCPATVPFTQSLQTHHFTSLAELLALE